MKKDFNRWNESKKVIDQDTRNVDFHEREIWWCSIGVNVGSEQHSQTYDFSRPVVVTKKFTERIFLGIPCTTKTRSGGFRVHFKIGDRDNDLLISQMRTFDRKRLIRKIGMVPEDDFYFISKNVANILPKTTDPLKRGSSEAEASVCNDSLAEDFSLSSEYLEFLKSQS